VQDDRLGEFQAALRHLPHADHGGDVIATIKRDNQYFAHYHTGGVPGRHEIDETQELQYPAIMRAIAETGFKGHVAQEFIPAKPDVLASLRQAVGICDV
jgi:hydroxypyruvate isomerase